MRLSRTLAPGLAAIAAVCGIGLGVVAVTASRHGLEARYYPNAEWNGPPIVEGLDERISTEVLDARVATLGASGGLSARWQGFLRVDEPGEYRFTLVADDVAWLSLDGRVRVNNGARGASRRTEDVNLDAGLHPVEIAFFTRSGTDQLELEWARGTDATAPIPADRLFPSRRAWLAWDALWGQAYLWPLVGSLLLFAALWWWPLVHVTRHCRTYARDRAGNRALWLLLAASFLLIVPSIGWGLPDRIAWAPDELTPMDITDGAAKLYSGGWHLKYPPLQLYLVTFLYTPFFLAQWLGVVDLDAELTYSALFVLLRAMSVAMGVGTVYVVYRCGLQLYDRRDAGLAAGALVACMPPFVYYAKMANVDVPYLFWFALSLLFYIRIVQSDRTRDWVGFALTGALAIITKDQAYGFYLLPVLHLFWLRSRQLNAEGSSSRLRGLWADRRLRLAAVTSVAVFAVGHNLLFNLTGFIDHIAVLVGPLSQEARQFPATPAGHLAMAWEALRVLALCLTPVGLLVCAIGLAGRVRAKGWGELYLLLPALSYYLCVISIVMYHYDRFFLGVCFILALFGGKMIADAVATGPWLVWRRSAVAGLFVYLALAGLSVDVVMANDSRYTVERWLDDPSHTGGQVGIPGMAIYLPRVAPSRALPIQESWREIDELQPRFIVVNRGFSCRAEPGTPAAEFYDGLRAETRGYRLSLAHRSTPDWPIIGPDRVWRGECDDPFTVLAKINPEIQVFERIGQ